MRNIFRGEEAGPAALDATTEHDDLNFVARCLCVYFVCLWGHIAFLSLCDHCKWLQHFKVQGGPGSGNPSRQLKRDLHVRKAFAHVIASQLLLVAAFVAFFRPSALGIPTTHETAPGWLRTVLTLVCWHATFDTYFYWAHRALHHRFVYAYVHKQHHEFKEPTGVAALYAHPVEDLLVNGVSTFLGPVLFPSHGTVLLIYLGLRFHETTDAHSGYDFPWSPWRWLGVLHGGVRRHDWHHSHITGNYGGFGLWDWLCGTDREWREWELRRQAAAAQRTAHGRAAWRNDQHVVG